MLSGITKTLCISVLGLALLMGGFIASSGLASAHTATPALPGHTVSFHPYASGGGCRKSSDLRISACISENSQRTILPDGYVNYSANCYSITIRLYQNGVQIGQSYTYKPCPYHFYGPSEPAYAGDQYFSQVSAVYSDGDNPHANSPLLYA